MSETTDSSQQSETKGYTSERGPFEINANPTIKPPTSRAAIDIDKVADAFAHESLAEAAGPEAARKAIGEMVKAFVPGTSTTSLFGQGGPNGMSLVHVWFGPNFPLFRHSHPRFGDCLYYVIAGEITMGSRTLGAGSTFFLPNGQPYKYTAGPAGVELLEFRAGGGEKGAPGMKLDERSVDAIEKIVEGSYANDEQWQVPERMGDTAIRQARLDGRLDDVE